MLKFINCRQAFSRPYVLIHKGDGTGIMSTFWWFSPKADLSNSLELRLSLSFVTTLCMRAGLAFLQIAETATVSVAARAALTWHATAASSGSVLWSVSPDWGIPEPCRLFRRRSGQLIAVKRPVLWHPCQTLWSRQWRQVNVSLSGGCSSQKFMFVIFLTPTPPGILTRGRSNVYAPLAVLRKQTTGCHLLTSSKSSRATMPGASPFGILFLVMALFSTYFAEVSVYKVASIQLISSKQLWVLSVHIAGRFSRVRSYVGLLSCAWIENSSMVPGGEKMWWKELERPRKK